VTEAELPGDRLDAEAVPAWFRNALDTMLDLVGIQRAVRDDEGRIIDFEVVYTNRGAVDVAGRTAEHLTGTRLRDLYPNIGPIVDHYARVVESGEPMSVDELPYEDQIDGRAVSGFFALQVARFGDGVLVVSRDVSEAVRNRRLLESSNRRLESAQTLAHVGVFTVDEASEAVWFSDELRRIFGFGPHDTLPGRDELVRTMFTSTQRDTIDEAQRVVEDRGLAVVFETVIERPDGDTRSLLVHVEREVVDGVPTGLWGTAQDITALRATQDRLDEAQVRLGSQRDLIDQFQAATLAALPTVPGVSIDAGYYPAVGASRLGGDWYDAFLVDEHTLGLAVGDVSGHGIPAVATMAQLRNVLRAYAYEGSAPAEVLARLNLYVVQSRVGDLATVLYGTYDLRTRVFRWSHAGHPPPVLVSATGAAEVHLAPGQRPVGFFESTATDLEHELTVPLGGQLVLYTDGLIERRGESLDVGLERLRAAAGALVGRSAGTCRRLRDLCVEDDHEDDVCILTLRATDEGPAAG
jgi:PAS domain S-box-containing protein